MEIARELWQMELGRVALDAVENINRPDFFESAAEKKAVKLLEGIREILDNGELSDFECVEEIVDLLQRANISTARHDLG